MTTILLALLAWSGISFAIHAIFLDDKFTTSAPYALIQDVRLLVFVLLVQSAIRSRGDIMLVLLAVAVAVLLQTMFVGLSYAMGHAFSYAGTAGSSGLQGFDTAGGAQLVRATGTFGQVNEQAIFHTIMTIPLIAFFGVRNTFVRIMSIAVLACSALAVVLTFSRGAWLAFPVGLAVCGCVALRRGMIGRTARRAGVLLGLASAFALLLLAHPIYQRLAFGDNGATDARIRLAVLATDLFQEYPILGVGPGEFDEAALRLYPPGFEQNQWIEPGRVVDSTTIGRVDYMEYRTSTLLSLRPLPVHNKFLLMLSELGIPGLLLWMWLYVEIIRVSWRCSKVPDKFLGLLGVAGLGTAAAEIAYMTVEHFHDDKILEVTLFVPAVLFSAWRIVRATQSRAPLSFAATLALQHQ